MIRSMTGYGRAQHTLGGREILVEIKSVNHRYFEFTARVPRACGYLEEKLKSLVQSRISRGKTEAAVTIADTEDKDARIEINSSVAEGYVRALRQANESLGLEDDLTLSQLIRLPDVWNIVKDEEDPETLWNDVRIVAEQALDSFVAMRETEGAKLKEDILTRLDFIEKLVEQVEKRSPEVTKAYRERLFGKLCEILDGKNIDEQRILTETAIFAEKTAVDEETVRLRSHIHQFRDLLEAEEPVGRKLDFLIQEFNRESNTIGSKAQDIEITRIVVELKSEIEKIREQIQNIE